MKRFLLPVMLLASTSAFAQSAPTDLKELEADWGSMSTAQGHIAKGLTALTQEVLTLRAENAKLKEAAKPAPAATPSPVPTP